MKNTHPTKRHAPWAAIAGLMMAVATATFAAEDKAGEIVLDPGGVSLDLFEKSPAVGARIENIQKAEAKGVSMFLYPAAYSDNLFCLSSHDVGLLMFWFVNQAGSPIAEPRVILELPESIHLLDVSEGARIIDRKSVSAQGGATTQYEIDISGLKNSIGKEINAWRGLWCMLQTDLPASGKIYPGRYWYADGAAQTEPLSFDLKVLPSVQGPTPSLFKSGAVFGLDSTFENDEAVRLFAAFYQRVGFNSVHISKPGKFSAVLGQEGIKRYFQPYLLVNGYQLGLGEKPDSVRFQYADGTYDARGICPIEVYREGEYFKSQIVAPLRQALVTDRQADSIMSNWEPYMYEYKGCFCKRCKEEFLAFSKLDRKTVDEIWPKRVLLKAYSATWIRFRSWQHAKLVTTLEKTIHELGQEAGIESHFIPEISWSSLTPLVDHFDGMHQYLPLDYATQLPVLEPWGPYCWYELMDSCEYSTGFHMPVWASAKATQDYLNTRIPDPAKRPQIIAFPHGHQVKGCITTPEEIEFDCLTFFLNRWNGAFPYYFPKGYDARYWTAMSQTNARIALFESYTLQGTPLNQHSLEILTPVPEIHPKESENRYLELLDLLKSKCIIQSVECQRDNKRLIAVGNFWQKGEVFLRLKVEGTKANTRYVLWEPSEKRHYVNEKGEVALSAQELAKGLTVHVGALRYAFFVLEPHQANADYGNAVSPQFMAETIKSRLPTIQKAFDLEQKNKLQGKADGKDATMDDDQLVVLKKDGLQCGPARVESLHRNCLLFASSSQQLMVDPGNGGRVVSWKVKNAELVHQEKNLGLLLDGFWYPADSAAPITQPYEVVAQKESENGLAVTLSRKLQKEVKGLEGLTVRKTLTVSAKDAGFTVLTEIENTSNVEKEFAFRYHNMPAFLEQGDTEGCVWMGSKEGRLAFKRDFICKMYRFAAIADPLIDKAFEMSQMLTINSPVIKLEGGGLPVPLQVTFEKNRLYSLAFWDGGSQPCATLEPIFNRTRLKPGEIWKTQTEWKAGGAPD